jgi:hypothetical protein
MNRNLFLGLFLAVALLTPQMGFAQDLSISLGENGSISARTIQLSPF